MQQPQHAPLRLGARECAAAVRLDGALVQLTGRRQELDAAAAEKYDEAPTCNRLPAMQTRPTTLHLPNQSCEGESWVCRDLSRALLKLKLEGVLEATQSASLLPSG